jgi:hypothetical protein
MQTFRGFHHPGIAEACAMTIGNFDGVHRGHQAMLALLINEARPSRRAQLRAHLRAAPARLLCRVQRKPELAPARIATLRDKLTELAACGVDQCVILKFDTRLSAWFPRPSSATCWSAASARATSWSVTTSASAPSARATTPCSIRPAAAWASTSPG